MNNAWQNTMKTHVRYVINDKVIDTKAVRITLIKSSAMRGTTTSKTF